MARCSKMKAVSIHTCRFQAQLCTSVALCKSSRLSVVTTSYEYFLILVERSAWGAVSSKRTHTIYLYGRTYRLPSNSNLVFKIANQGALSPSIHSRTEYHTPVLPHKGTNRALMKSHPSKLRTTHIPEPPPQQRSCNETISPKPQRYLQLMWQAALGNSTLRY